jgi:hypothetical protein
VFSRNVRHRRTDAFSLVPARAQSDLRILNQFGRAFTYFVADAQETPGLLKKRLGASEILSEKDRLA